MHVYFLRHGETDWNVKFLYQGGTDIPLNENGRQLAVRTGQGMAQVPFDLLITSGLDRAQETGVLILRENAVCHPENDASAWPAGTPAERGGIRYFTDARLKEIGFGCWEGLCYKGEGYNLPPHRFASFWDDVNDEDLPALAETKVSLFSRVHSFFDELAARYGETEANVLIVSHGGVARAVKYLFGGAANYVQAATGNCEVLLLDYAPETGWRVTGQKKSAEQA